MLRRILELAVTGLRQSVPVGGLFALGWQPAVALAVYWLESVLLAGVAVAMCYRLRAQTSRAAIAAARAEGDHACASALDAEARRAADAGVNPGDVMLFHWGSLGVFGGFFTGILVILMGNGRIEPLDWAELKDAATAMAVVVGLGFILEWVTAPRPQVALVQARVDACNSRWALLWLLGFGGTLAMALTGRPQVFFLVFAGLKATWEMWGLLTRTFGWKASPGRAPQATPRRPA